MTTTTDKPVRYCIGCDRPMWSMSPDELDIPGVKHASKGRCDACYSADRRAGRGTLRTYGNALTDQDMRNLRRHYPAVYAWHVDRRNRGIPAEGLRKETP